MITHVTIQMLSIHSRRTAGVNSDLTVKSSCRWRRCRGRSYGASARATPAPCLNRSSSTNRCPGCTPTPSDTSCGMWEPSSRSTSWASSSSSGSRGGPSVSGPPPLSPSASPPRPRPGRTPGEGVRGAGANTPRGLRGGRPSTAPSCPSPWAGWRGRRPV